MTDNRMSAYSAHVSQLREILPEDKAFQQAVGGNFDAVGRLERDLLIAAGLQKTDFLVDVGCGCGRLAFHLAHLPDLKYVGTDVVQDLLDYAAKICVRPDWTFRRMSQCAIPLENEAADMVCFFSVLTHLTHPESFRYVKEAARVLKKDGKLVLSFLEFHIHSHWPVFEVMVNGTNPYVHLDQFISRDAIYVWAMRAGFRVERIEDGDKRTIPLSGAIVWDDGRTHTETGSLGQSYAILTRL